MIDGFSTSTTTTSSTNTSDVEMVTPVIKSTKPISNLTQKLKPLCGFKKLDIKKLDIKKIPKPSKK